MPYPEPRLVLDDWQFLEMWIDTTASPPYVLMLLCSDDGLWHILDPAEGYQPIFASYSYEEAKLWLLEDEYECVMGRVTNDLPSNTDDLASARSSAN